MDFAEIFRNRNPQNITRLSDKVTRLIFTRQIPESVFHTAILENLDPDAVLPEAPNRKGVAYNIDSLRSQLKSYYDSGNGGDFFKARNIGNHEEFLKKIMPQTMSTI